jgi:hypothetical protein
MVLRAKPRTTVVAPARRDGRLVEGVHSSALGGGEGEGDVWKAWPTSPWAIQNSGLPRCPNPAAKALGCMI